MLRSDSRFGMPVFICFFTLFLALSLAILPLSGVSDEKAYASPGEGWEECNPEDVSLVYNVAPIDSSVAWIAGQEGNSRGVVYRTENGGQTWVKKYESPASSGGYICKVFALDENTAWFYGFSVYDEGFISVTRDGGATWDSVYSRRYKWPLKLVALDDSNIWMLGVEVYWLPDLATGQPATYSVGFIERTSDGGVNWVRQYCYLFYQTNYPKYPIPIHSFPSSFDLDVVDSSTAWGIIYDRVIKTGNWGLTWDIQLCGEPFTTGKVTAVDPQTAWVALGGEIKKTSDGGMNWETRYTAETGEAIYDIAAVDTHVAWALLLDKSYTSAHPYPLFCNGRHLKTIEGGASWVQQDTPGGYCLMNTEPLDASIAWSAGAESGNVTWGSYAVVFKTTDGGDARPDIVSISPSSGETGVELTVIGCDFGDAQDTSYVSFGGVQASEYNSWSDGEIRAEVPEGIEGEVVVTVTTSEGASNTKSFTVTTPIPPPCGEGSGTAVLVLGLTLGLLSLAGSVGSGRRRRKRKRQG